MAGILKMPEITYISHRSETFRTILNKCPSHFNNTHYNYSRRLFFELKLGIFFFD